MSVSQKSQEDLLHAWMQMSVCIRGNRILSQLSFNEMMLCGMLYRRQSASLPPLSATELGDEMRLLKSQMNHILTSLENRGYLERVRGTADKRVIHVYLTEDGRKLYEEEHARVMEIMAMLHTQLGDEDTRQLTTLITKATNFVTSYTER